MEAKVECETEQYANLVDARGEFKTIWMKIEKRLCIILM